MGVSLMFFFRYI